MDYDISQESLLQAIYDIDDASVLSKNLHEILLKKGAIIITINPTISRFEYIKNLFNKSGTP